MTIPDLLVELGCAGITIRDVDGGLGCTPRGAITADRSTALLAHKPALLEMLAKGYVPDGEEQHHHFEERMGRAEELGMPVDVGSPAWLIAMGEAMGGVRRRPAIPTATSLNDSPQAAHATGAALAQRLSELLGSHVQYEVIPHGQRFANEPNGSFRVPSSAERKGGAA